jgi:hypothetical protein
MAEAESLSSTSEAPPSSRAYLRTLRRAAISSCGPERTEREQVGWAHGSSSSSSSLSCSEPESSDPDSSSPSSLRKLSRLAPSITSSAVSVPSLPGSSSSFPDCSNSLGDSISSFSSSFLSSSVSDVVEGSDEGSGMLPALGDEVWLEPLSVEVEVSLWVPDASDGRGRDVGSMSAVEDAVSWSCAIEVVEQSKWSSRASSFRRCARLSPSSDIFYPVKPDLGRDTYSDPELQRRSLKCHVLVLQA